MLALAEDEQEEFIKQYKKKVFFNVRPSSAPEFVALVGAKGAGKSTLAKEQKNAALVAPDDIMSEYWKSVGADPRGNIYDKDVGLFASKVSNILFGEAFRQGYDVVYDASTGKNTKNLMKQFAALGYSVKMKAIIGDDMRSQLNVVKRKLQHDRHYSDRKSLKPGIYLEDENPLQVPMEVSARSSFDVIELLTEANQNGTNFEVYEFGKSEPSYVSGQKGAGFEEYLEGYLERLPKQAVYENECRGLIKEARSQGNADLEMQLICFRNRNGLNR